MPVTVRVIGAQGTPPQRSSVSALQTSIGGTSVGGSTRRLRSKAAPPPFDCTMIAYSPAGRLRRRKLGGEPLLHFSSAPPGHCAHGRSATPAPVPPPEIVTVTSCGSSSAKRKTASGPCAERQLSVKSDASPRVAPEYVPGPGSTTALSHVSFVGTQSRSL